MEFGDQGTEDIANRTDSKAARRTCPSKLLGKAHLKLALIDTAKDLGDLRVLPGNRLEALSGDLQGWHSIRINDQYRIIFRWSQSGPVDVSITDYH